MQGTIYQHCCCYRRRYNCHAFRFVDVRQICRAASEHFPRFEGGVEVFLLDEPSVVEFPFTVWVDEVDLLRG